jgi:endonuclease YncB( thermonuclease family)
MREKISNITTVIFLGIFFGVIFNTSNSDSSERTLPQNSQEKFDQEFSGRVSVIDGDSIRVSGNEVRLLGVDAPEYRQTCFDSSENEYECGKISRSFLVKLASRKTATCTYFEKDIYNRYLAKCFIGELSINDEILKNGMGVIYDFTKADKKEIELEKFAKSQKLGIWQGAFELPKDYRKKNPR